MAWIGSQGRRTACRTRLVRRLHLPLLFAAVRGAFFRSVACPVCLLELKTRVPKLAQRTEPCLPRDDVGLESGAGIPSFAKLDAPVSSDIRVWL